MKRIRRVEVVRYSRRSTVISNEEAFETELAGEQVAIDALLEIPRELDSAMTCEHSACERAVAGAINASFVRTTRLLRLVKKVFEREERH